MNSKNNKKREYSTIKHGRKSGPALIVLIIVILAIAVLGILIGVFVTNFAVDSIVGNSGYSVSCLASPTDVNVDINKHDKSDDIEYIKISVEGINIPENMALKPVTDRTYPRSVLYEKLSVGIHGTKRVSIEAFFKDGSKKIIWMDNVKFN